jgi:hypothetical protein
MLLGGTLIYPHTVTSSSAFTCTALCAISGIPWYYLFVVIVLFIAGIVIQLWQNPKQ